MKQWVFYTFLAVFLLSCGKKTTTKFPVEQHINFSKVDTPPIFVNCKDLATAQQHKCFEETIKNVFNEVFFKTYIKKENTLNKNFTIKLTFHKTGKILINKINYKDIFVNRNIKFEKLVEQAVHKLQIKYPATKQGIPVTTTYKLPVQINFKE